MVWSGPQGKALGLLSPRCVEANSAKLTRFPLFPQRHLYTQGEDVTLDNMPDPTVVAFTDDAYVLKLKPRVSHDWSVLGVSGYGTPTSDDTFMSAAVGPKGDLYAYLYSNADELALDSALTLENDFAGDEFLTRPYLLTVNASDNGRFVMTAVVKMERKTLEIVEGIQSVYSLPFDGRLAVDK